jgi:hypothetical protein
MSFECLMNIDSFGKSDQKINTLVEIKSAYKNGNQFLIEAEVKNAETLEIIKQITTDFVSANISGDIQAQAVSHLKSIFLEK